MIKSFLTTVNEHFQHKQKQRAYKPDENNLKIIRKNGFVKNLLRLCNKTMIGINRIHISRWNMFAAVFGLLLGYTCKQSQQFLLNLKQNYRKDIKHAIIHNILQNQEIKDTLNRSLLINVYTNHQVQYSLHQLLDWKVIRPQQHNLFMLSKQAILKALNNKQIKDQLIKVCVGQIQSNRNLISAATLQFLQSDKLINIVIEQISAFFKSQTFYSLLTKQFICNAKDGLTENANRQKLYNICRDQFLSW